LKKEKKQYYFTLNGAIKRLKAEYKYFKVRPWSLEDVGKFWDTVLDYDIVNSKIYPYYRRFTNSYSLSEKYLTKNSYRVLDVQSRSANGTEFWNGKINIKLAVCVDFSNHLISLAMNRLENAKIPHKLMKISELPIPIDNSSFDLILCYETVEHIFDYDYFIKELSRLITNDGIIILTCPAVSWEWVHWLSAIININHSEGPHRFLKSRQLSRSLKNANLEILSKNNTILLPFNNKISITFDRLLEKYMPTFLKSIFMLRRTFILKRK
jgi:ubiquinone/menaquinone biosynthesis C-methylase UbiE